MNIVVIGGVAAGTKAAAKMKRENRNAQITILTKSSTISYAGCGLPYYIGGSIDSPDSLIVNTPEKFTAHTGVTVRTGCEVTAVHPASKTVTATDLQTGNSFTQPYDKLVIATGATALVPQMEGSALPGVFCVRTPQDAIQIRSYLAAQNCREAVVVGAGFIGLEMAENLKGQGLSVTLIDAATQIMPNAFDREMADFAKKKIKEAGIQVLTNTKIVSISGSTKVTGIVTSNGSLSADLVLLAIGIRPATDFLAGSGIACEQGTILVDQYMQTNVADIYAAGDCALVQNRLTGAHQWSAMGSTANLSARALAKTVTGTPCPYSGCLGTGIVRLLPTLNAGRTGLTLAQAKAAGLDAESIVCVAENKPNYYPGSSNLIIKLLADRNTRRLLGIQVLGADAVDKIVDIAVAGIGLGATIDDFDTMDFAYAPPFSTAIHPFTQACTVLENKISGSLNSFTPFEYNSGAAKEYTVIDAMPSPKIPGAHWVDLTKVTAPIDTLGKEDKLLLVCNRGKRAYFLQNRLKALGYTNTKVLEGGITFNTVKVSIPACDLPASEIKRVKGLGCLQDKQQPDHFNLRVITRNGKLTSREQKIIADAAEQFGSGEVTMTTRLTMEIQGVPYANIDDVIEFLAQNGLEIGGTGSKVRPIVSCKGTTCQYGLIDTFALSEKLHGLFYKGYHEVSLPHKFKIAVGGCPNNCVKPDLNDLGIVGQRIPQFNTDMCKGCKVCQVEKVCPIHIAKLTQGKLVIDPQQCNHCGRCIGKCPFKANDESIYGYKIYLGGRWGKKVAQGRPLDHIFTTEQAVIDLVERAILLFRSEGISGERFSDTISRLGFDYVQDKLLHGQIYKDTIIQKNVVGGATC